MILAIETSCDETAIAILDGDAFAARLPGQESSQFLLADIISSQTKLHSAYGGVVPELAAREHLLNLPILVEEALRISGTSFDKIKAIAVTRGPGLKGSLLVGLSYAKALAWKNGLPLLALHHIEGHIFAGLLAPEVSEQVYPMLVLIVSGGHTQLVQVSSFRQYEIVAKTKDDAAGEAFDKCATILGFSYPGGPSLANSASNGDKFKYSFPIGMKQDERSFSFSGLKTAVLRAAAGLKTEFGLESGVISDLAASVQYAIVSALVEKSIDACLRYRPSSFLLTGGVAANQLLRETLSVEIQKLGIPLIVPEKRWCTDNAAMMAVLAHSIIEKSPEKFSTNTNAWNPGSEIGPGTALTIGVLPRWPLTEVGSDALST